MSMGKNGKTAEKPLKRPRKSEDERSFDNNSSKRRKLNSGFDENDERMQSLINDIARWTATINEGLWLNNEHVNHVQHLLSKISSVNGLQPVEVIACNKYSFVCQPQKEFVQILNFQGNHWICTSNLQCQQGTVNVFDSMYTGRTNFQLKQQLAWLMKCRIDELTINWPTISKQIGGDDCGLFALANATALCYGIDPSTQVWDQQKMRDHLVRCFSRGSMTMFPTVGNSNEVD